MSPLWWPVLSRQSLQGRLDLCLRHLLQLAFDQETNNCWTHWKPNRKARMIRKEERNTHKTEVTFQILYSLLYVVIVRCTSIITQNRKWGTPGKEWWASRPLLPHSHHSHHLMFCSWDLVTLWWKHTSWATSAAKTKVTLHDCGCFCFLQLFCSAISLFWETRVVILFF